jgi:hypothetical protein
MTSFFDKQLADNLRESGPKRNLAFICIRLEIGKQLRTEETGDTFGDGLTWFRENCPEALHDYIEYFFKDLPEQARQRFSDVVTDVGYGAEKHIKKKEMVKQKDSIIPSDMRGELLELFAKGPEVSNAREVIFEFLEGETMRPIFSSDRGLALFEEVIEIASNAGAPLEEVRARIIPLIGEERFKAYANEKVLNLMKSGAFGDALEKVAESKKQEYERKQRGLIELKAAIYDAEQEQKKKSWVRRLFS